MTKKIALYLLLICLSTTSLVAQTDRQAKEKEKREALREKEKLAEEKKKEKARAKKEKEKAKKEKEKEKRNAARDKAKEERKKKPTNKPDIANKTNSNEAVKLTSNSTKAKFKVDSDVSKYLGKGYGSKHAIGINLTGFVTKSIALEYNFRLSNRLFTGATIMFPFSNTYYYGDLATGSTSTLIFGTFLPKVNSVGQRVFLNGFRNNFYIDGIIGTSLIKTPLLKTGIMVTLSPNYASGNVSVKLSDNNMSTDTTTSFSYIGIAPKLALRTPSFGNMSFEIGIGSNIGQLNVKETDFARAGGSSKKVISSGLAAGIKLYFNL
jgi:hypothetical protein